MRQLVRRFGRGEEGGGLVEYALIVALVAICLMGILHLARNAIGGSLNAAATDVSRRSTASYGAGGASMSTPGPGGGGVSSPRERGEEKSADSAAADPPGEPSDST